MSSLKFNILWWYSNRRFPLGIYSSDEQHSYQGARQYLNTCGSVLENIDHKQLEVLDSDLTEWSATTCFLHSVCLKCLKDAFRSRPCSHSDSLRQTEWRISSWKQKGTIVLLNSEGRKQHKETSLLAFLGLSITKKNCLNYVIVTQNINT